MTSSPPSRRALKWAVIGTSGLVAAGLSHLTRRLGDEHGHVCEQDQATADEHQRALVRGDVRGIALEAVAAQLEAAVRHGPQSPWPSADGDEFAAGLLTDVFPTLIDGVRSRDDAARAAVVGLAQRAQTSAHRMQELAARMVRNHPDDSDILESAMQIDQSAAREARRAQSLTVLCGEWPGRQWPDPVPLADVVRAASGRITAFRRVQVAGYPEVAVVSSVAEPLIHLVAELLDNATQSSPPTSVVPVAMKQVYRGWAIEIEDDGVGLDADRLRGARELVSGRQQVALEDLGVPPQTGLAVVGAIARRHRFRVDLTESMYGGVCAVVVIPDEYTVPATTDGTPRQRPTLIPTLTAATSTPAPQAGDQHPIDPAVIPAPGGTALPQRRSRRGEAPAPTRTARREDPAAAPQTPAEAGQWMGEFTQAAATDSTDVTDVQRTTGSIPAPDMKDQQ